MCLLTKSCVLRRIEPTVSECGSGSVVEFQIIECLILEELTLSRTVLPKIQGNIVRILGSRRIALPLFTSDHQFGLELHLPASRAFGFKKDIGQSRRHGRSSCPGRRRGGVKNSISPQRGFGSSSCYRSTTHLCRGPLSVACLSLSFSREGSTRRALPKRGRRDGAGMPVQDMKQV